MGWLYKQSREIEGEGEDYIQGYIYMVRNLLKCILQKIEDMETVYLETRGNTSNSTNQQQIECKVDIDNDQSLYQTLNQDNQLISFIMIDLFKRFYHFPSLESELLINLGLVDTKVLESKLDISFIRIIVDRITTVDGFSNQERKMSDELTIQYIELIIEPLQKPIREWQKRTVVDDDDDCHNSNYDYNGDVFYQLIHSLLDHPCQKVSLMVSRLFYNNLDHHLITLMLNGSLFKRILN